jgi:hypothetical protein
MTKVGKRIAAGVTFLITDTKVFEATKTKIVARPRPTELTTEFDTPSKGHSPNNWTNAGLLSHKPLRVMSA